MKLSHYYPPPKVAKHFKQSLFQCFLFINTTTLVNITNDGNIDTSKLTHSYMLIIH